MKILMLLRHGKSAWDRPGLPDRERPLAPRGVAAATAMGRMMTDRDWLPDLVLTSDAARARQTQATLLDRWPMAVPVRVDPILYLGGAEGIADAVRRQGGEAETVLVVGHNPDMEQLILALDPAGSAARRRAEAKVPTGALARFVLSIDDWRVFEPGRTPARFTDFVTPRDLKAGPGD